MQKPAILIIAGGASKRFFPFHTSTHKSAVTLLGSPLIVRTVQNLISHHFTNITVVLSPKDTESAGLKELLHKNFGEHQLRFVTQPEPQGMGDAVLHGWSQEMSQFAVVAPYHIEAGKVLDQLLAQNQPNMLCSTVTDRPWDYGIIATTEEGRVTQLIEKPTPGNEPSDQKVQALYLLSQDFIQILKGQPASEYNFEEALQILVQQQPVFSLPLTDALPSLKYPWDLFNFQTQLFGQLKSYRASTAQIAPTAVIDEAQGAVYLGENVSVGHASRIVGPCFIGDHCQVGDFALVRQSSLEEGSSIGAFSEVARSILLKNSSMHSGFIGDSIIGNEVKIGAGIITANKRLDRKSIEVEVGDKKINSGKTALGAIIGDHSRIGIQVGFMPGKAVGARSVIFPQSSVYQNLPHEGILK